MLDSVQLVSIARASRFLFPFPNSVCLFSKALRNAFSSVFVNPLPHQAYEPINLRTYDDFQQFATRLRQTSPTAVRAANVPNRRLSPPGQFAIDPEDVWELAESCGYTAEVNWMPGSDDGSLEAFNTASQVRRRGPVERPPLRGSVQSLPAAPWTTFPPTQSAPSPVSFGGGVEAREIVDKPDNANRELIFYYVDYAHKPAEALRVGRAEIARRQDIATLDAYAWALYSNGQYAEARVELDKALKIGIRDATLFGRAGAIAEKLKDQAAAANYRKQARELRP